jgi:hypothetical protein
MSTGANPFSGLTYVQALEDPQLLGALPCFRNLTPWRRWIVFLRALEGLPLDEEQQAVFRHHTGRTIYAPSAGGYREAAVITGRQSGKTRIASAIQVVDALRSTPEADGTSLYAVSVAQDLRASLRTMFSYATAPLERIPLLRTLVRSATTTTAELRTGVTIAAYPCRPAAVRGLRARIVVADELAFYVGSDGNPTDKLMLQAVRPMLATTNGRLVILSSPYGQAGALYDLHQQHFGRDDAPVLVWQATAPEMNPLLPADYLQRMALDDPDAYRSEVLGEFRAGLAALFDADRLEAAIDRDVHERLPERRQTYFAGFDAASGQRGGGDAATLAIAHHESPGVAVLDCLRVWEPPFAPNEMIASAAAELARWRLTSVEGDAWAPGFVEDAFRSAGVRYVKTDRTRSEYYLELLPLINAGRVRLLDRPDLLRELRGLERQRGAGGKDRVDHRRGAHDDRANATAISLVRAAGRVRSAGLPVGLEQVAGWQPETSWSGLVVPGSRSRSSSSIE